MMAKRKPPRPAQDSPPVAMQKPRWLAFRAAKAVKHGSGSTVTPELLAACLDNVQSGRQTIEACLADHPTAADELRPLLRLARAVGSAPPVVVDPTFRQRGRAALLAALSAERAPAMESASQSATVVPFRRPAPSRLAGLWAEAAVRWNRARRALRSTAGWIAVPAASAMLLIALLGGAAASAAQSALPDDALYPVKRSIEAARVEFAAGDDAKAQLYAELAAVRLAEVQKAVQLGRAEAAQRAADDDARLIERAVYHLGRAAAGRNVEGLAARLSAALAGQSAALAAAQAGAPVPAQPALARAAAAATTGLTTAAAVRQHGVPSASAAATPVLPPAVEVAAGRVAAPASDALPTGLAQLAAGIQELSEDGDPAGETYGALHARFEAAQEALAGGEDDDALLALDAFLQELNGLLEAGLIGVNGYDALYAPYSSLVSSLSGTPQSAPARPSAMSMPEGAPVAESGAPPAQGPRVAPTPLPGSQPPGSPGNSGLRPAPKPHPTPPQGKPAAPGSQGKATADSRGAGPSQARRG